MLWLLRRWILGDVLVKHLIDMDARVRSIRALEERAELWEQRHEKLEAAFKSFRGQVYAWRGKLEVADDAAQATPTSLADPSLSKAQVKAALGLTTPAGVAAFLKRSN